MFGTTATVSTDNVTNANITTATVSHDMRVNTLTVGLGTGQLSTDTAFGYEALYATDASSGGNVAVGYQALAACVSGPGHNVAIGTQALTSNTSGFSNTAVGYQALQNNVSGSASVAIGTVALENATGGENVGIGYFALQQNTSGANNIALGFQAGYTAVSGNANVSGANNTWVGYNAGPGTSSQLSNSTALGNGALNTASNQISLGNSSVTGLLIAGTAGVTQAAEAVGTIATTAGIVTTFTGVSDERLKDFAPYEDGLSAILGISPIRFTWNQLGHEFHGFNKERAHVGFSAQNVQRFIPESIQGTEGEEKYLSFDDRPVIAALVNAVKELTARIKVLEEEK
jgi:hypothetical protein